MPKNDPTLKYTRFKGVNNAERASRLQPDENGIGWLTDALNVDIDDSLGVRRRPGFVQKDATAITSAYVTRDEQNLYIVQGGSLLRVESIDPWVSVVLKTGLPSTELQWCEAGNMVFYVGGTASGIIVNGEVLPFGISTPMVPGLKAVSGNLDAGRYVAACLYRDQYGREGGYAGVSYIDIEEGEGIQFDVPAVSGYTALLYVSNVNGDQLFLLAETTESSYSWLSGVPTTWPLDEAQKDGYPLPVGVSHLAFMDSAVWAAVHDTANDISYIHRSRPFFYHLFPMTDYIAVRGKVLVLADVTGGMVIGTDKEIYAYNDESGLSDPPLADYGVIPGQPCVIEDGKAFLWTSQGVCTALPFQNLTDDYFSVPPGIRVGLGVREQNGRKMLIALTDTNGIANNPY